VISRVVVVVSVVVRVTVEPTGYPFWVVVTVCVVVQVWQLYQQCVQNKIIMLYEPL
jgi:hypothetical protein